MALSLAVLFLLSALAMVFVFAQQYWWFPAAISSLARDFDHHFLLTLALTGFFFFLAHVVLSLFVVRFREGRGPAAYTHGNIKWVWAVVGVMALLDLGLAVGSEGLWSRQHLQAGPQDPLQIEVMAEQFAWNVHYAGPDGEFGGSDRELVDAAVGNPLGLIPSDPAAQDDIVLPTLLVPVNQPVEVLLESKDVIHSFFVRELRIKQDAVPGMRIPLRFTADQTGRFEVACAELCGQGHHQMRTFLEVLEPEEFEKRMREYLAF